MNPLPRLVGIATLLGASVLAQDSAAAWAKRLELPAMRELASERLLALGAPAVQALRDRLDDPRPEVLRSAAYTLGFFGAAAKGACERLHELREHDDPAVALAARSAVSAIEGGRGFVFVVDFGGTLRELDGAGAPRVQIPDLDTPRSGQRLGNGNYLVSTPAGAIELTPAGKEVWRSPDIVANDAQRLTNGNTLIAAANAGRVFEVDANGKTVWEFARDDREFRPVSCQRLGDGRTLIAHYALEDYDSGSILEVGRKGETAWALPWRMPARARRLPNDRTLIVSHRPGRVQIVDRAGRTLQSWNDVRIPSAAEYLPNGHLLVGGEGYLRELDASGKRVWNTKQNWIIDVRRQ